MGGRGIPAAFASLTGWAVAVALIGLLLMSVAPRLIGGRSYAVLSDSMAPSIETGDLVVVLPRRADEIEIGEIVAFADPDGSGRTLQHRVQRVSRAGTEIEVVTMGDANSGYERWSVPAGTTVGRVAFVIGKAGYLFGPISRPIVRHLITAAAWLVLLGFCLLLIWRPRPAGLRTDVAR